MKTHRISALVLASALAGCTGGGTSHGTIDGQVTSNSSFGPVAGSTVTAFRVQSDGSLTAISDGATTDVSGRYSLDVSFTGSTISDVIVQAEGSATGGFEGEAIVSGTLHDGGTVSAPPMTDETRVEADVYVSARVQGDWDGSVDTTAALREEIDADTSAALSASTQYAADVAVYARACASGLKARAHMLVSSGLGVTSSQLGGYLQAETDARAQLDGSLDAALTPGDVTAALDAWVQAIVSARTQAGITLQQMSDAVEAQVTAVESASVTLSSSVRSQLSVAVETARAEAIADANESAFVALGASGQVQSDVASARVQLESAIQASAGVEGQITSAWHQYDATVEADLKATVDAAVTGSATAIDQVQAGLTAAQSAMVTAVGSANGDVDAIVSAYSTFTTSVHTGVEGNATLSGFGSQTQVIADVLASADLNG